MTLASKIKSPIFKLYIIIEEFVKKILSKMKKKVFTNKTGLKLKNQKNDFLLESSWSYLHLKYSIKVNIFILFSEEKYFFIFFKVTNNLIFYFVLITMRYFIQFRVTVKHLYIRNTLIVQAFCKTLNKDFKRKLWFLSGQFLLLFYFKERFFLLSQINLN